MDAAPILVRSLVFNSLSRWEDICFSIQVEQQIELVLCRIAGIAPVPGKSVFGIRSTDESNIAVNPLLALVA